MRKTIDSMKKKTETQSGKQNNKQKNLDIITNIQKNKQKMLEHLKKKKRKQR